MLDIQERQTASASGRASRRDFIRVGAMGLTGLTVADWFRMKAHGKTKTGRAKAVIQLWMAGGPTHTDTFDPKPQSGEAYCGPYKKPIATKAKGVRIGELLPKLAAQADKFSILRSMTHPSNAHETAAYMVQTGTVPSNDLVYPSVGAVVALKKGAKGGLPPYIVVPSPLGRFSAEGFLGSGFKPFATGGDPNAKNFRVGGLVPARGMSTQRLQERRSLLQTVDELACGLDAQAPLEAMDAYQQQAYGLILGDAKKAFDIAQEKDELRDRYGRNRFGQSCLLARRLIESGVPFVTVNYGGWDTHKQHFDRMGKMLPVLDQGFAALLEDLSQRGLLDSTIVVWCGEFGRTPKIAMEPPWNGGRHHFSACFSAVVAGGGFRGGAVVGASDPRGESVRDRPVYPWDLSASLYKLLGIDPTEKLPHPHGCVAYVTPVASGQVARGGLLTEIM